jgi:hypothetical protein
MTFQEEKKESSTNPRQLEQIKTGVGAYGIRRMCSSPKPNSGLFQILAHPVRRQLAGQDGNR